MCEDTYGCESDGREGGGGEQVVAAVVELGLSVLPGEENASDEAQVEESAGKNIGVGCFCTGGDFGLDVFAGCNFVPEDGESGS
jgi:hypothetical protein